MVLFTSEHRRDVADLRLADGENGEWEGSGSDVVKEGEAVRRREKEERSRQGSRLLYDRVGGRTLFSPVTWSEEGRGSKTTRVGYVESRQ